MGDSNNIKKNFGRNIKKLRKAKGLTQEQLAEKLNLQLQTISFIENGRTFVSSEVIADFADYFGVEPYVLFMPSFKENTDKEANLKKDINSLLFNFNEKKLKSIYNIIIALQD